MDTTNNTTNNTTATATYAVRMPGCSAWADSLTRAEAIREWRLAQLIAGGNHRIAVTRGEETSWDESAENDARWPMDCPRCDWSGDRKGRTMNIEERVENLNKHIEVKP
jgi:hypothetical protein